MVAFQLNGVDVSVEADGVSLLDVLREHLGVRSAKDGCAPQGQCGCCTVWVDGQPRVACVTPIRRVEGRDVRTLEGIDESAAQRWADALCATGGTQCGFCTPGIVMRLEALRGAGRLGDEGQVIRGLAAHLCRCTGWRTIVEAAELVAGGDVLGSEGRDFDAAARRASIEGRTPQVVGPQVAKGAAGFADDSAPDRALVAVLDPRGEPHVAATTAAARAETGKVQGRRTTRGVEPPLAMPEGEWAVTLATSWVEPAYLETDCSWAEPGGVAASPLANGGAFGGKAASVAPALAERLAAEHGTPVKVRFSREDTVRLGPKRPPVALGVRADGTGVMHVVRTPGVVDAVAAVAPGIEVTEVDVAGPPTSVAIRGAGWAEAAVALAAATGQQRITAPGGGWAEAAVAEDRAIEVTVGAGDPLDEVVLRSYAIGAAHQALGWVTSEGLAVDDDGTIGDLTIRSFGIVRPGDMPEVRVTIAPEDGDPVCGSDAVFAAVALAVWRHQGLAPSWPTGQRL